MSDTDNDNKDTEDSKENMEQVGDLIDAYTALDTTPISGKVCDSSSEDLKVSLAKFVQHYLQRVRGHKEIEDILKKALIERLPEADFQDVEKLLNTIMRNSNNAVEKILIPFSQKEGTGNTNNTFLFGEASPKPPIEEKMLKDERVTPDMIKGLYDLAQLMNALNAPGKK